MTTTHRRRGMRSPPHAGLRRAAPARRLRTRGAAPARTLAVVALTLASDRSSARSRPISTRKRARCDSSACFARNARADERLPRQVSGPRFAERTCEREQHWTPCERDHRVFATHDMTARVHDERPELQHALRPPQAGGVAPRHAQSGAPRACSGRGMRFPPPPSVQGYRPGARHARPERAQRAPPWPERVALRSPQRPVRRRPSTRAGTAPDRARRVHARPRRDARSGEDAGPRDAAHARRSPSRRVFRASPAPRRAPSPASPGRARRARSRPRRRHTSRGPPPLSDRRRAPHFAGVPSRERNRRAAPSRCLEARGQARRHAGQPASRRRGDHPRRVRAPQR